MTKIKNKLIKSNKRSVLLPFLKELPPYPLHHGLPTKQFKSKFHTT